jgi:hypothetical protein
LCNPLVLSAKLVKKQDEPEPWPLMRAKLFPTAGAEMLRQIAPRCGSLSAKSRLIMISRNFVGTDPRQKLHPPGQRVRELAVSLKEHALENGRALREEMKAVDEATRRELELSKRELAVLQKEIGLERAVRALHDEVEVAKAEIPQVPAIEAQLNAKQAELDRHAQELRAEITIARQAQAQVGEDLLRREVAALREQIGLQHELESLRKQVVAAKAEIPCIPDIEARVEAKQSALAAEQARLDREMAKTKDRLGKLRVDQSVTDHGLKELQRAKQPVIELKFESVDGCFTMRDMHPDAVEAWRRFAAEIVAANDGTMFSNDPTGRVVALTSRKAGAA